MKSDSDGGGDGPSARSRDSGAKSPLEKQLVALLREVLERDDIHVDDNFFELGANSLLLARVHQRLERLLERQLAMIDLFNHPTVRNLAAHLSVVTGGVQATAVKKKDDDRWADELKAGRKRRRRRRSGGG